ncbi:TonB-dependent receptor [Gloeobacter violaceus]|nr:TonB-dependent receptor [Gloeobacter violaceus]
MNNTFQRKLGSSFVWAALLPALSTGLMGAAVYAQADQIAGLPQDAVARATEAKSQTLSIEDARQLLDKTSAKAADLEYRPPLWDWTALAVQDNGRQRQTAQATPATAPTAQAPGTSDEPDEQGDVLDEVSVTATRRATRARDTPSVVYAVKKEDFQAVRATTATDALTLIPGFTTLPSLGGVRGAGGIFLRGFDDQRFQVLRDGLSIQRSSNNRSDLSSFVVDDLERIEVVTGGATLRYGSGAVGGVINLITETPKGPPKLTLQYLVGNYGNSRYLAKYGGGDDTFSYNLVYSGVAAFNDYPFSVTLPNQAQFYGPTTNPNSIDPFLGPGFNSSGLPGADPDNSGDLDLYGFMKPEVGPPLTVSGVNNSSINASDTYTGKITFKPDPDNKLTLRVGQLNSQFRFASSGNAYGTLCTGSNGLGTPGANGTLLGERYLPLNPDGTEAPCPQQRYFVNTPSNFYSSPYFRYSNSLSGVTVAPGQAYQVEPVITEGFFYQTNNQSQTEAALQWDLNLSPTTTLNSYVQYFQFLGNAYNLSPVFNFNTNIDPILFGLTTPGQATVNPPAQPYFEGRKFEAQTAINTQISPGQNLQFGVNYNEDRSYQQKQGGRRFFDQTISRTSIFLIDDISFSEELKLNVGFRYTYSTQFGSVGTPGAGLRYTPSNFISLRTNWNYIFNAPSISDLNVSGGIFVANPNLKPESGVAFDAGVDVTPLPNVSLQATYFNIYLDGVFGNAILPNPNFLVPGDPTSNFAFIQQRVNRDTQISTGFELLARWQVTPELTFQANYTNSDSRLVGRTDSIDTTLFIYQLQNAGIPFNNAGARLTYANKGWLAALVFRYQDGFTLDYTTFTPSWATLDINVEVPLTPFFTVLGSVRNVTNTTYENPVLVPAIGTNFLMGGRFEIGG